MIHAYAIEPDCVVKWCEKRTFRLITSSFGIGTPRVFLEYPKFSTWKRDVYATLRKGAGPSSLDEKRLEELFRILGECRVRRTDCSYDGTLLWLENTENEHLRLPFSAIIALSNPRSHQAVLMEESIGDDSEPLWFRRMSKTPSRRGKNIAAAISNMIRNADELHLIDPNFGPENPRHRIVVESIAQELADGILKGNRTVIVHCRKKSTLEFFEETVENEMAQGISKKITIRFKRWNERAGGEKLHNRYVLSRVGGVTLGVGLDEGTYGQTDDINLMDKEQFRKRWDQYVCGTAFDLVDEPKEARGTKS